MLDQSSILIFLNEEEEQVHSIKVNRTSDQISSTSRVDFTRGERGSKIAAMSNSS
jgi:hypothetical protein